MFSSIKAFDWSVYGGAWGRTWLRLLGSTHPRRYPKWRGGIRINAMLELRVIGGAQGDLHQSEQVLQVYEGFRLRECERDWGGMWLEDVTDGNDHSIDAVRCAMMGDVLRGGFLAL